MGNSVTAPPAAVLTAPEREAAAQSTSAISVTGLTKRFGSRLAVDNATFEVPAGVVAGFVGPNGAGKTTTMRMLLGLVRPSSGDAKVLGQSISQPAAFMPEVGALIEGPAFYGSLSGRLNLEVLATLGRFKTTRIDEVLEIVGLEDRADDAFKSYSLGMKQRLGIAAALLREPKLLLLDEPTNGLDPMGIHDMRTLIRNIAATGLTVLLSSHLLSEVQSVCSYLVIVDRGRLLYQGSTQALLKEATESLLIAAETSAALDRAAEIARGAGYRVEPDGGRLRIFAPPAYGGELSRALIAHDIALTEIVPVRTSLEDRFLQLTGEQQ